MNESTVLSDGVEALMDADTDDDGERDALGLCDSDTDADGEALAEGLADALGDPLADAEGLTEADGDDEADALGEREALGEIDCEADGEALDDGDTRLEIRTIFWWAFKIPGRLRPSIPTHSWKLPAAPLNALSAKP